MSPHVMRRIPRLVSCPDRRYPMNGLSTTSPKTPLQKRNQVQ